MRRVSRQPTVRVLTHRVRPIRLARPRKMGGSAWPACPMRARRQSGMINVATRGDQGMRTILRNEFWPECACHIPSFARRIEYSGRPLSRGIGSAR